VLGGFELGEYSLAFNVTPGGVYPRGLADGAFDRYARGSLSLRFHLR